MEKATPVFFGLTVVGLAREKDGADSPMPILRQTYMALFGWLKQIPFNCVLSSPNICGALPEWCIGVPL